MLKGITVTFEIDPKDFALLLSHAGRMTINTIEALPTPQARAGRAMALLPGRKNKKQKSKPKTKPRRHMGAKAKLRTYAEEKKHFDIRQAIKDLRLPRQFVYNAASSLTNDKFITRTGKGTYAVN